MKKVLIWILIFGVLLGGGYLGYRSYTRGRQVRLVKQARSYLDKNNPRKALLALQRALHYNTNDVEACRLMARLGELNHSPGALFWRGRVVQLDPGSVLDRVALAQTALTFRDLATATHALEGVSEAGKKTAAYHVAAGATAAESGQLAQAEAHFLEAVRIDPQNDGPQLNLAVVHLEGTNLANRAEGQAVLQKLVASSSNSFLRCQALRELLVDSMRHQQMDKALALSSQLLLDTNSVFHDRILRLETLQEAQKTEFKTALAGIQREAAGKTNSGDLYELASWQMLHTTPAETLAWLKTTPSGGQTNPPVAMVIAEAETMLQDWEGLARFLAPENWGELDFLRHAFYSRALRGLNNSPGGAKAEWELALKSASVQKTSLTMLLTLTRQWNWQSESEELLWTIVDNYPREGVFVQELTRALYGSGRTRSMMLLCSRQLKRAPDRLELKRNLALLALLLDAEDWKPHELAREVYEKAPANASYAATYAFSLLLQRKKTEALRVMQKLTPEEAQRPGVAGYYGLVLQANGETAKAGPYLDLALKRPMLPEERKLFLKAKNGV